MTQETGMEPQRLPPGQGWQWIKRGYALFMKAPPLWIVLLIICILTAIGLSSVPVVGEPLASLLLPALMVGLMAGCRALEQGDELELAHLFSGFQRHTTQLVTLGGITLVCQYLIFGVMMLSGGSELVGILTSGQPVQDPAVIRQAVAGSGAAILLGATLFSMLMMAMQFAPMLVFFSDMPPFAALRASLSGSLRNIIPYTVYSLIMQVAALALGILPFGIGLIVLLPLGFTSLYVSYRNIFPFPGEIPPAQ